MCCSSSSSFSGVSSVGSIDGGGSRSGYSDSSVSGSTYIIYFLFVFFLGTCDRSCGGVEVSVVVGVCCDQMCEFSIHMLLCVCMCAHVYFYCVCMYVYGLVPFCSGMCICG